MTISSTETNPKSYSANGTTTAFTFDSYFLADGDLRVETLSSNVPTLKTLTTDYTVSGAGDLNGGTITFVTAPASGLTVRVTRFVSSTQVVDYVANYIFPAETHEQALDRLTMLVQQALSPLGLSTYDAGAVTGAITRLSTNIDVWDLESKVLSSGASAVAGTDIPTLTQVQGLITSSTGTVPTPTTPGQDDYFFVAVAGTMTVTSPAASRTALGLGTAALQNTGIVAGDVVAVQSGVELPAVGADNITGRVGVATRAYEHANYR